MSGALPEPNAVPPIGPGNGQVQGYSHGHSRSRGHTRSRYSQPPLSLGGTNPVSSQTLESTDSLNSNNYSYGHASQKSWSGHQHSDSQPAHHNHTHSVATIYTDAPEHEHEHEHGHDHQRAHSHSYNNDDHHHDNNHQHHDHDDPKPSSPVQTEQMNELIASALIALPWIAISWYSRSLVNSLQLVQDDAEAASTSIAVNLPAGSKTCILTAMTLLIFGSAQTIRRSGASPIKFPSPDAKFAQAALLQIISISLPIYAAMKIGGFVVAFSLLLASASGVPSLINNNLGGSSSERYRRKPFTIAVLGGVVLLSFLGLNRAWSTSPVLGYFALVISVFIIPPPFALLHRKGPIPEPGLVAESISQEANTAGKSASVIAMTDAPTALYSGAFLMLVALFASGFSFAGDFFYIIIPSGILAASLMIPLHTSLRSASKFGLAAGTGAAAFFCTPHARDDLIVLYATRAILTISSFFASRMDDSHLRLDTHSHKHTHHHHDHSKKTVEPWPLTKWLIQQSEPYSLLNSILKEKDSRSIFFFMCLNFLFMLVQLSYGFITGSLGLLSDSIHMFFDCLALVVGLCAAVMSKWPPNVRFPYGYGKVDTLSGFANGIFLMIISIEIIYEAVERLYSGSQMNRIGELLAVSFAGLLVNLVGIFSFEHGHHGHDHGHDHSNENMHGIFLHILADTLGSVAVVISTILVHYSGWAGYDPLASCFIAILIFASAVPLVTSTAKTLLMALPADTEYNLRETLAGVSTLRGVVGYTVPKFWLDDTGSSGHGHGHSHDHDHHDHSHDHSHDHHSHPGHNHHNHAHVHTHAHEHEYEHEHKKPNLLGVIHVIASRGADLEDVRQRTETYLRERDMDVLIQVERDGDSRCWCGGANKGS